MHILDIFYRLAVSAAVGRRIVVPRVVTDDAEPKIRAPFPDSGTQH